MNILSRRFDLQKHPTKKDFIVVVDINTNEPMAEMYIEHAIVVGTMYENLLRHNVHAANEFMYGHVLGMTYYMLHQNRYPKMQVTRNEAGQVTKAEMVYPDGTVVNVPTTSTNEGVLDQVKEQMDRAGLGNKGNVH